MLPRSRRVKKSYFKPYFTGKTVFDQFFSIRILPETSSRVSKVAVIVSKKVAKSAVDRNTLRRRIYSAFRDISLPSEFVYFVYPRKEACIAKHKVLIDSIKNLLTNKR